MKIVIEEKEQHIAPKQVYGRHLGGETGGNGGRLVMVIEGREEAHVYERFGLLDLVRARMVTGWTNEATVAKYLADNGFQRIPDENVELQICLPK